MMRYNQLIESKATMKIMPGDELLQHLNKYHRSNTDWDKKLRYLHPSEMDSEIHIVHMRKNKVVSSLGLQINPYDKTQLWLKHVTVDPAYRNQGLATELYQAAINLARSQNRSIKRSTPSDLGTKHLSHVVDRLKLDNTDVKIIDHDK